MKVKFIEIGSISFEEDMVPAPISETDWMELSDIDAKIYGNKMQQYGYTMVKWLDSKGILDRIERWKQIDGKL